MNLHRGGMLLPMAARTKRTRQRPQSARGDAIEVFGEKMRAISERDQALQEVVELREAGKIREARAKLKQAEKLHARVATLGEQLKSS
jgi:hypothetical protein